MTSVDIAALRGIGSELCASANVVLDHAISVKTTAVTVDPSHAGRDYRQWGDRIAQSATDIANVLAMYGQSVSAGGSALGVAATAYQQQDQSNANRFTQAEAGIPT
ncbi:hypothetical protein [Nocardia sp. NBC_00403]|uniref:hypothetical protein n=1 Tax=Nocardia sp. NBC_00403 TaxID=2975990 RepID=UPI002E2311C5